MSAVGKPTVSVSAVVLAHYNDGPRVLLVRVDEDHWVLPCGELGFQETISDAIVRVVHDQTGLTVHEEHFLEALEYLHHGKDNTTEHKIVLTYSASRKAGDLTIPANSLGTEFVSVLDLADYCKDALQRRAVSRALAEDD